MAGIHSAEQWVAWQCGVSPGRTRSLVRTARRLGELPETRAAFGAGELSEDQVAVVCRHAPAAIDAEVTELARSATVSPAAAGAGPLLVRGDAPDEAGAAPGGAPPGELRRHRVRVLATFGRAAPDEGALVERALTAAREELFRAGEHGGGPGPCPADVSWADALVAMAEKSLAAGAVARSHRDRHLVLLHLGTDGPVHQPQDGGEPQAAHLRQAGRPESGPRCSVALRAGLLRPGRVNELADRRLGT